MESPLGSPARLSTSGVAFGAGCYVVWGVVPIYWKAVAAIPALEMLPARILWTLVLVASVAVATGRRRELGERTPAAWAWTLGAASILALNWGVFIYAVQTNRVLATSLGYYINPLVSVVLGMLVLDERLTRLQALSALFALAGVGAMTIRAGELPWISLVLAASFALYGLFHKLRPQPPLGGLVREMMVLAPFAALALGVLEWRGGSVIAEAPISTQALVSFSGPLTALPLLLFHAAARRLPLVVVGMFQYIAPTFTFALATIWYREPFTRDAAIGFGLVWLGLGIFLFDAARRLRKLARQ
jgi:chloramphenicol-sensitive protein RarD